MPQEKPIVFYQIAENGVHGWVAEKGNKKAEVVRCFENEWACFRYVDNIMLRNDDKNALDGPKAQKMKEAREFLK